MEAANTQDQVHGHWRIGSRIRTYLLWPPGGKMVTHEGQDLRTGEPVGILLLRSPWHKEERVRADLRHGTAILRQLDHRHLVKTYDVIEEEDFFAVVTEPLQGDNLVRHVRYGSMVPTEAQVVQLLLGLASALEYAHQHGVIFGNVKPTNIEVFPDGGVKLLAFPKLPYQFTSFLGAGDYLGYPVFNAPEMLRAEPLDARTDVYGLGICAYQLIVSRMPFQPGENLGTTLRELVSREWPAPAEIVEEIHPQLNKVVARCLQKDPANRYPSVTELLKDLRFKAGSGRLISSARLQEIVVTAFPAPLAVLARSLERDDHLLAQKDKLLGLANGVTTYLGFLAAQGLGQPLSRDYARPTLGRWVELLRQGLQGSAPAGWPLEELRGHKATNAELLRVLDEILALRNQMAHQVMPEEGAMMHEWVKKMTASVRRLYKSLLWMANYSVVVVEDLDFHEEQFSVRVRRLDGVGDHSTIVTLMTSQPYTKGRVYLTNQAGGRLVPLHPWVLFAKCPLCFQRELFFYASGDEGKAHYVTADRGHSWSCETPPELKKALTFK